MCKLYTSALTWLLSNCPIKADTKFLSFLDGPDNLQSIRFAAKVAHGHFSVLYGHRPKQDVHHRANQENVKPCLFITGSEPRNIHGCVGHAGCLD
jgi:hypothetical protein